MKSNYNIIFNNIAVNHELDAKECDSLTTLVCDEIFSPIVKCTHPVGEAIIYDEDEITEFDVNWNRVFELRINYTGYEFTCNEFIVPFEKIQNIPIDFLAVEFLKRLKKKFIDMVFVVYFFVHDGNLEFRFHVFREEDGIWISDFDDFKCPFLCIKG